MKPQRFGDHGIDPALHMIRGVGCSRMIEEREEMRQSTLYQRSHPAQVPVCIPPPHAGAGTVVCPFHKKRRVFFLPCVVSATPCARIFVRARYSHLPHERLYVLSCLGLGATRQISPSELEHVEVASLDCYTRPHGMDGFQKPFLSIADDNRRTRHSFKEAAPCRSRLPRRKRPAGGAVFRERHEDDEGAPVHICAIEYEDPNSRRRMP